MTKQVRLFDMRARSRPFIILKQVPAARLAILRNGFNATTGDPAFLAEMEKQQLPVHPLRGEDAEAVVAKMANASPGITTRAKAIYE